MKLAELLIKAGKLTKKGLQEALLEQKRTNELLGQLLIRKGFLTQDDLADALAEQAGVGRVDLQGYRIERDAVRLIPLSFARKHKVLPLS